MADSGKIIIAFDLYGTLLSTESIKKKLATHFGEEKAQSIATLWRRFQLEYTWRMNSMSLYKPFSDVTRASLGHALSEFDIQLSEVATRELMEAYDSLDTFPDVKLGLQRLAVAEDFDAYIFSNGTDAMVSSSVNHSPSLAAYSSVFKDLITVDRMKLYKPDPRVYEGFARRVGKTTSGNKLSAIWLVSSNPFDIVGARAAGLNAAWVNRNEKHHGKDGWTDRLGDLASGGPTIIIKGVDEVADAIRRWNIQNQEESQAAHSQEASAT